MTNEVNNGYGERLRSLRKALNKTQMEFAGLIKTTNGHISDMEKERKNLSERSIKIICGEFNVNEEWLRTGNGGMFNDVPSEEIEKLAKRYKLPCMAKRIIKAFVELNEKDMGAVMRFIGKIAAEEIAPPVSPPEEEYRAE
ncbi:MAG: helix-turn-helix domain-containing protein [Clostridiales bacterium]|jgi:transcriptional regulator with XRE-family HTH domain|nr:helix-turn-helix domain-containing protein [Clostridiales bacterium]